MSELDFALTIRREFESGYLRALTLRNLTLHFGGATIEFSAHEPFEGRFALHVPLPERTHDDTWNLYDDTTDDLAEWTRWGVAVPLEEAYLTQARSGTADERGVIFLRMP